MSNPPRTFALADLGIALGIIALGLVAAWQTTLIPQSTYAAVGPRVFPWVASVMLVVMGGLLLVAALRGGWSEENAAEYGEIDWRGGAFVVAGLIANLALIDVIGFILASTVVFTFVALGFGSRNVPRDAAIGFTLALVAYVGFDRVLGYKIGSGLIERLI
ncbi:MAG: tripartite tricarboxylate transporter TctB family protein [Beijerinckiaceae bacterium]